MVYGLQKMNELPVIGTMASTFNDPGCNELFNKIIEEVNKKTGTDWKKYQAPLRSESHGAVDYSSKTSKVSCRDC